MHNCPCGSGKSYEECCEPIIQTQSASTALSLMRSRFTAYHISNVEYLLQTTHVNTRAGQNPSDIEKWSQENAWLNLEILSVEHGKMNESRGIVEFKAHFESKEGLKQIHHERSTFLKENNQWFYLEGDIDPKDIDLVKKISRNDPCSCGSGKKFKKCCA